VGLVQYAFGDLGGNQNDVPPQTHENIAEKEES
jgi:hypothetical protein